MDARLVAAAADRAFLLKRLRPVAQVLREAFAKIPTPRNAALFASTLAGDGVVRSEHHRSVDLPAASA